MTRRRCLWLCLLLLVALLLVPGVHWRLIGWANGEPFYQGRPTSYWAKECQHWIPLVSGGALHAQATWIRQPSGPEGWLAYLGYVSRDEHCPLVQGDPESIPVLLDLMQSNDGLQRQIGLNGLELIGPPARAAVPLLLHQIRDSGQVDSWVWQALESIDPDAARKLEQRPWRQLLPADLSLEKTRKHE